MRNSGWLGGIAATLGGAITVGACSDSITLQNARPRATWVAVEPVADDDVARLTVWLADVEGDAVDVVARWSAGGQSGALVLAAGSYPLVGLPTREAINDPNGEPHLVLWDLADVPDGPVTLTLELDDTPYDGKAGDTYTSGAIDPRAGSEPVQLTR